MDGDFGGLYEELFGEKLAEPEFDEDVKRILSCIRTRNGYLDTNDEAELRKTSQLLHRKVKLFADNSQKLLARFTKAISSQLYDDPFRFFFELIQNADDASYSKGQTPTVTFRVRPEELIVELNEQGFSLADVLAICSTGQSSKIEDTDTTGEKGFGFKAVFGVASTVHIQSGPWSFSFRHERHQDGIGMVTPIWQKPSTMLASVQTRFVLTFSNTTEAFLNDLCCRLEEQPVTIVCFLRKIKKLNIIFDGVPSRHKELSFEHLGMSQPGTWIHNVKNTPSNDGRVQRSSKVTIYLPVKNDTTCEPEISAMGQYVFAYLPIRQVAQLPFLIQANFILPGSRQDISDNPWNRALRTGVAEAFAGFVCSLSMSAEPETALRHKWLRFLPSSPIPGFWQPLQELIRQNLDGKKAFLSRSGVWCATSGLRFVHEMFTHKGSPLLPQPELRFSYLSDQYEKCDLAALTYFGVETMSSGEMFDMVHSDSYSSESRLHQTPLNDDWHTSFAQLLRWFSERRWIEARRNTHDALFPLRIIPVRNGDVLEWWSLSNVSSIYFPILVEDGHGLDRIQVTMPTDLGIAVLHPQAATDAVRKAVYGQLGVKECSKDQICRAIESAQRLPGSKRPDNLLSHFELLFWFLYRNDAAKRAKLQASTAGGIYRSSTELFLQSEAQFDAAKAVRLNESDTLKKFLLNPMYQKAQMKSRIRGSYSWEQWLHQVAEIRWYPALQVPSNHGTLHWALTHILSNHPHTFVPMVQAHWTQEYAETCRFNTKLKQAVQEAVVPCRNGNSVKLTSTWFPSPEVFRRVDYFDVEIEMPILSLPSVEREADLLEWSCLNYLGTNSKVGLELYRQILVAITAKQTITMRQCERMGELYRRIGNSATLEDQADLKSLFASQKLIWDPVRSSSRSSSECVWKSKITLRRKFVIVSSYDEQDLHWLFSILLGMRDVSIEDLIDELIGLQGEAAAATSVAITTEIYALLEEMATDAEKQKQIRTAFKEQGLIFGNGMWSTPKSCVWHESMEWSQHVPIAGVYPSLERFFTTILGVSTVTDVYMMKLLVAEACKAGKDAKALRDLILSTGAILSYDSLPGNFSSSIEILSKANFLPCRLPSGALTHLTVADDFFVVDNEKYAEEFRGQLPFLDFTYQELNTLHVLFRLLRIEQNYLSENVELKMTEGEALLNQSLTKRFQNCAYAISCCAVLHQSPLYFNRSNKTHNLLRRTSIFVSPDIRTRYQVTYGSVQVEVEASKAYLMMVEQEDALRIVLPQDLKEQKLCLRRQLPGELAKLLGIEDSKAEKQIYRFINETEMGTDELMVDEEIPHTDEWLIKTLRLPQPHTLEATTPQTTDEVGMTSQALSIEAQAPSASSVRQDEDEFAVISTHSTTGYSQRQQRYIPIPAMVNHTRDAPQYDKVLDHVRRQAAGVKWRNVQRDRTLRATDDLPALFSTLAIEQNSFEPESYPSLFGSDEFANFRLGAAGELFVFEVLKSLTDVGVTIENWQSSIRHYVRAHNAYSDIERLTLRETADLTYADDEEYLLEGCLNQGVLGDNFDCWLPSWMTNSCPGHSEANECGFRNCANGPTGDYEPIEWLFEVKATTGPCKTEFFLSSGQYDRMQKLGTVDNGSRKQVYCIVRVYNLLSEQIGIRFFIDPWRFRGGKLKFKSDKWRAKAREE